MAGSAGAPSPSMSSSTRGALVGPSSTERGGRGTGSSSGARSATTTIRWRALYFGWQAVSVSRLSPLSSSTSTWVGDTISCSLTT